MAYDGSIDKIVRYGTKASRPTTPNLAPNVLGTYVATDTSEVSYWTGSAWTSWASIAPPLTNPMTTAGDIVVGGSGGTPTRLAAGTNGYVLTMVSGAPAWAAPGAASLSIQTVTSSSTVTPLVSNDKVVISAQAAALTIANPSGTAADGQGFVIALKDNGTTRTITFDTNYRAMGAALLASTTAGKWHYIPVEYNAIDSKWDVMPAVVQQ